MAKPADRPRCSAMVSRDIWHQSTCSRRGAIERDGQWYCRQHDPVAVKAKRDAEDAKYRSERQAEEQAKAASLRRSGDLGCGTSHYEWAPHQKSGYTGGVVLSAEDSTRQGAAMSRSGYSDLCEGWELIRWRGAVESAIRGKRGQAFLREMLEAPDAMPEKRLAEGVLVGEEGEVCAMGAVAVRRGVDVATVDDYDREAVAALLGIAPALAAEVAFWNDDDWTPAVTPESRWRRMRGWVSEQLKERAAS